MKCLLRLFLLALAAVAGAVLAGAWPPDEATAARIEALRATLSSPEATDAERKAAREELRKILRTPGAPEPAKEPREPRAAIIPSPSLPAMRAPPAASAPPPSAIEIAPRLPAPIRDPATGAVLQPSGKVAIDPKTGRVLVEVPNGYIDQATGRFIPK